MTKNVRQRLAKFAFAVDGENLEDPPRLEAVLRTMRSKRLAPDARESMRRAGDEVAHFIRQAWEQILRDQP